MCVGWVHWPLGGGHVACRDDEMGWDGSRQAGLGWVWYVEEGCGTGHSLSLGPLRFRRS